MVRNLRGVAGFSLIELLIALLIATSIGALVFTIFAVQNRFYAATSVSGRAQQTARGASDLVASELRAVSRGALRVATPSRLAARVPLTIGIVCSLPAGGDVNAYFPLDGAAITASEVKGFAVRASSGSWSYTPAAWGSLFVSSGGAAVTECTGQGGVSSGFGTDYMLLNDVASLASPAPDTGSAILLYTEIEYRFAASALEPGTLGLFRGPYGGTLVEYASGFAFEAQFEYRLANGMYQDNATGVLDQVTAIRLVAAAAPISKASGRSSVHYFDVTTDVPLRNAR
jgi:Tfp pilus assembly protein PilV